MKELINWCNQNEGFLSFVLSAVTIVIRGELMGSDPIKISQQ